MSADFWNFCGVLETREEDELFRSWRTAAG